MDISFKSKIIPMHSAEFSKYTSSFNRQNFVDYPWTISTSRVAQDVFTNHICDCTACLITDGEKALLMHLSPERENNHDITKILNFISNNIDLKKSELQAVLAGSNKSKLSMDIFNKFKELLGKLKIPTTILQGGKMPTHLAYRTSSDEVIISNSKMDEMINKGLKSKDIISKGFEQVQISDFDTLI